MDIGFRRYQQILPKFYSCTLVMVTEKAKLIENWLLLNLKGMFASNGMRGMHRKRTVSSSIHQLQRPLSQVFTDVQLSVLFLYRSPVMASDSEGA
jgi:hypothetical protein